MLPHRAGGMTTTPPQNANVLFLGTALSATTLYINGMAGAIAFATSPL